MQLPGITAEALQTWLTASIQQNAVSLTAGNQGRIFLCREAQTPLIIKTPVGAGILKPLYLFMLRHEYRIYRRLEGIPGIPKCYGLLQNRYLVLEYIEGKTLRQSEPENRDTFYAQLFTLIQNIHQRGVAHMDLKRKENILIGKNDQPILIDFGAACKRRDGCKPLNHHLFRMGMRYDLNAWLKHKYLRQYTQISSDDHVYLHRTWTERSAKKIKQLYRKFFQRK